MIDKNNVLANARIVDVENGEVYLGAIEVESGYIKNILKGEIDTAPDNVIDLGGKYILPGLIDMHCHINEKFARQFVASGVTTVRNTAGSVPLLKNLIEAPIDAPTPRVYAADRMIDGPPGLWGPTSEGNFVTDSLDEAREEVRSQVQLGAKFIKVYGWLSKNVMEVVVDEARKFSLEVSCDLIHSTKVNALEAAEIGVSWFEHASGFIQAMYPDWNTQADKAEWAKVDWENIDMEKVQDICKQMLVYDVKICPTLLIFDQVDQFPNHWHPKNPVTDSIEGEDGLAEYWRGLYNQLDAYKNQLGIQNKLVKAITKTYFDLGGTVVAGTDTPAGVWSFPGMGLHRELELFVEIGFTELEAIQSATIKAAESIKLDDIGYIQEGKIADLLILNSNPLEDIRNTKDIHSVVKGGKVFEQVELLNGVKQK